MAGEQRAAREPEEKYLGAYSVRRQRPVGGLQPAPCRAKRRLPVRAHELADDIRAEMRTDAWFKVKHLALVLDASVMQARHVRNSSRDALPRALEEQTSVHVSRKVASR